MQDPEALLFVDLGFGDQGKGTSIDAFTARTDAELIVRYNGGSQAAHNVVANSGLHHVFAQFGSGFLASGTVQSLLGPGMLVNPINMWLEAQVLAGKGIADAMRRSFIHEDCLMVTPFHVAMNRIREKVRARAGSIHGSCGQGIGETREYTQFCAQSAHQHLVPTVGLINNPKVLREVLEDLRLHMSLAAGELLKPLEETSEFNLELEMLRWPMDKLLEWYALLSKEANIIDYQRTAELINTQTKPVLFEGAQGVLLDETHGFYPHNTWTDTTLTQAYNLLNAISFQGEINSYGIIRTFPTRHGEGPFPTEDEKLSELLTDPRNPFHQWQREFRVGFPDLPMLRYALSVVGDLDGLIVTHVDYLKMLEDHDGTTKTKVGVRYTLDGKTYSIPKVTDVPESYTRTLDVSTVDVQYEEFSLSDLLSLYKATTGLPIKMTSAGPMTKDKTFF